MSALDDALAYAAQGFAVFPLHTPGKDGACDCPKGTHPDPGERCSNVGKHPRNKNGHLGATTDTVEVRRWWSMFPRANIGIACGPSGLVVLDVDPRHGGDESYRDLVSKFGAAVFATRTALTGGGGEHKLFLSRPGSESVSNSAGLLGPGLDIRAAGGYVVAPPSLHASGRRYEWEDEDVPLLPFPAALVVLLGASRKQRDTTAHGDRIREGQRNATLASLAGSMRRRGMSEAAILAALLVVNAEQCDPPLNEDEVRKVAASIGGYEPGRGEWAMPGVDQETGDARPLPEIIVNGEGTMTEATSAAWQAIEAVNSPVKLAVHANRIVRVEYDRLVPVGFAEIRHALDQVASWRRWAKRGAETVLVQASPPPRHIVENVLATPNPPLPHIKGVIRHPFFGKDGQLVARSGFDASSGLLVVLPPSLESVRPGSDVAASLSLLREALCDFPFAESSDEANALGFTLTPYMRPYFDDITPLADIDATVRSAGKGLLAQAILRSSSGGEVATTTIPRDESTFGRKLFAALLHGSPNVLLDNVTGKLVSPVLEAALTSQSITDRLLGGDQMGTVANRVNWLLTGNQFDAGGDLPRRLVPIRLVPRTERPELRTGFRHPDLLRWMDAFRRELVIAALTLGHAWLENGGRNGSARMASFESWARTISGVLEEAGVNDFLANRRTAPDGDVEALRDFVTLWFESHGSQSVTSKVLFPLYEKLTEKPFAIRDGEDRTRQTSFGMKMKSLALRISETAAGTFLIREAEGKDPETRGKLWKLELTGTFEPSDPQNTKGSGRGSGSFYHASESTEPLQPEASEPSEPFSYSPLGEEEKVVGSSSTPYGARAGIGEKVPKVPEGSAVTCTLPGCGRPTTAEEALCFRHRESAKEPAGYSNDRRALRLEHLE